MTWTELNILHCAHYEIMKFRIVDLSPEESTSHRSIPRTKPVIKSFFFFHFFYLLTTCYTKSRGGFNVRRHDT